MAKIIQSHEECIGCGLCVSLCPKFWEMHEDDNRAHLIGGKLDKEKGEYELEIEDGDIDCNQEAVDSCPVQIIKII